MKCRICVAIKNVCSVHAPQRCCYTDFEMAMQQVLYKKFTIQADIFGVLFILLFFLFSIISVQTSHSHFFFKFPKGPEI